MDNLFKFNWIVSYDPLRKSDVFYCEGYNHTPLLYIEYMDKRVMISCDGEMHFEYNDVIVRHCEDLVEAGIHTDAHWTKAIHEIEDGLFPWFDAYEWDEDSQEWQHLDMVNSEYEDIILQVQKYMMNNLSK
jgi:hypothetical protein